MPYAPSAVLPRNLVNAAAVLVVVLGSKLAVIPATLSSITHGSRASSPANVGFEFCNYGGYHCFEIIEKYYFEILITSLPIIKNILISDNLVEHMCR